MMATKEQVPTMGQEVQSGLQIFNNPAFGEVRVTMINDEPYFCLMDVCRSLELEAKQVARRLSKDVFSKHPLLTNGGSQLVNFINEDGLYDVILDSRKNEARSFRKWVTSEVLPSIRKKGGYLATMPDDNPETIMARAILIAQDKIKEQAQIIEEQKGWMQLLSAKADYTTQVLQSESTYTFTQIAKELGVSSAKKLLGILHEKGIIYKASDQWLPYAKFSEKGYFATRTAKFLRSNETIGTSISTVVTEKGRCWLNFIFNKFNTNQKSA